MPHRVVVPVVASAVAQVGYIAPSLFAQGAPRFLGVTGIAIVVVLAVGFTKGPLICLLTTVLTIATADYLWLGPAYAFGVANPCHAWSLAALGTASIIAAPIIASWQQARAHQPIGMGMPDGGETLICEPGDEMGQVKALHIVRDI